MAETPTTATNFDTQEYAAQASQVMNAITGKLRKKRNTCPKNIPCKFCERRFSHSTGLLRHVRSDHPESKPFECTECGNRYERKLVFESHMRKHEAKRTSAAVVANGANHVAAGDLVERHSIADNSDGASYVVAGRELLL